jgi:hypothetical protein
LKPPLRIVEPGFVFLEVSGLVSESGILKLVFGKSGLKSVFSFKFKVAVLKFDILKPPLPYVDLIFRGQG